MCDDQPPARRLVPVINNSFRYRSCFSRFYRNCFFALHMSTEKVGVCTNTHLVLRLVGPSVLTGADGSLRRNTSSVPVPSNPLFLLSLSLSFTPLLCSSPPPTHPLPLLYFSLSLVLSVFPPLLLFHTRLLHYSSFPLFLSSHPVPSQPFPF